MTAALVSGGLGRIGDGMVEGWAYDPKNPSAPLRVAVLLDGDIVAFGRAERPEPVPDLAKGEEMPACGFACEVPKTRLHTARLLTIMAETVSGFALLVERALGGEPALAPARGKAVHFDITDLLEFLVHHREVSGIQRVQCGYLANALAAPGADFAIRVCAQPRGAHRYVEIDRDTIEAILAGIEGRRAMPDAAWRRYIEAARLGAGTEPDFRRGDIILTTGAPWVYEEYYRAILQAKREHGVYYFQISYDLIPVVQPETAALGIIGGFTRSIAGMLDCADHILAISHHTERDLQQTCATLRTSCPPVSVIPMGATLTYLDDAVAEAVPDGRLSPRDLYGDYVLCVGTIEPRKNHAYLHAIWRRMLEKRSPGQSNAVPKLVCVGRMGWHMESFERLLKASDHLDGHFVHLTEIGDDMLARLYRDCLFTVFPSIYEGWGLPVAESLLFGKLCVCSNTSSLPEVGGEWAVYLDPHDLNDGERVIAGLLDDPARIARLERKLREGYRPVTWRDATQTLLASVATAHAALADVAADTDALRVVVGHCYDVSSTPVRGGPLRQLAHAIELGGVQRLLAGPDWHTLEPWGCWSCGAVARLGFRLTGDAASDEVAPGLACHLVLRLPGGVGARTCKVVVDGVALGAIMLTDDGDDVARIPLSGRPGQVVRVELRLDRPIYPARNSADQRLLGIGIRSVSIRNEMDLADLLAYFEKHILVASDVTNS
jgi:glycosyltransferase involved in cell wall biosynthesis